MLKLFFTLAVVGVLFYTGIAQVVLAATAMVFLHVAAF